MELDQCWESYNYYCMPTTVRDQEKSPCCHCPYHDEGPSWQYNSTIRASLVSLHKLGEIFKRSFHSEVLMSPLAPKVHHMAPKSNALKGMPHSSTINQEILDDANVQGNNHACKLFEILSDKTTH
ncbi:hypothetical protein KSP40_PGU016198 [Platanthera guangdongensis]|uniref:Uncharacterized protein n=1 Tax=Platanthera guangdongensis TaxID=2320717 RepID=A0ABR2MT51_9ASPA